MTLIREKFQDFNVYQLEGASSFVYFDVADNKKFIRGLVDYLFSEQNLLGYANSLTPIPFEKGTKYYNKLVKELELFLNSELETLIYEPLTDEVRNALGEEYSLRTTDGKIAIQKEKIGKIGEYAFHVLLTQYFQLDCIIPKFRLLTDRNMSAFGIDALFYNQKTRTLYFGESKVCGKLTNAICLANKSLADYSQQIKEEYKLILSSDHLRLSESFTTDFQNPIEECLEFDEFIQEVGLANICIPIFLAHGQQELGEEDITKILKCMKEKITQKGLFKIETQYLLISLPIIDKHQMVETAMKKILELKDVYDEKLKAAKNSKL